MFGWVSPAAIEPTFGITQAPLDCVLARRETSYPPIRPVSPSNLLRMRSWIARRAATSCVDSFLGSGSTVIAAERTGRRCFGIEIDPLYVDVIIRRWQAFTGKQAVNSSNGCSFEELAREAEKDDGLKKE